jgi:hypothetical protein
MIIAEIERVVADACNVIKKMVKNDVLLGMAGGGNRAENLR